MHTSASKLEIVTKCMSPFANNVENEETLSSAFLCFIFLKLSSLYNRVLCMSNDFYKSIKKNLVTKTSSFKGAATI